MRRQGGEASVKETKRQRQRRLSNQWAAANMLSLRCWEVESKLNQLIRTAEAAGAKKMIAQVEEWQERLGTWRESVRARQPKRAR